MTHDLLQELKVKVVSGQMSMETAMDTLYLACLKEIGQVYDKFNAPIPVLENPV
jgi:hypothetical protein